jgi:hypothetical protein
MTELLTEQQAAALLQVSVKSLQAWRVRGGGPPFVKLGRCVRYSIAALEAFVKAAVRHSTSDRGSDRRPPGIREEHFRKPTGRATMKPAGGAAPPSSGNSAGKGKLVLPTLRRHAIQFSRRRVTIRRRSQD